MTEIDPICALQAAMEGYRVLTVEDTLGWADIYVTTTGNCNIIRIEHMEKMKDQAIVCNIGHFDNEIQVHKLQTYPGIRHLNIKPQVDRYTFPSGNSLVPAGGRAGWSTWAALRPSQLRDVQQLRQPGASPAGIVEYP